MQENYFRKNEARKKWLQLKTRTSWNTYIDRRKQAKKKKPSAYKRRKNGLTIK